MKCWVHVVPLEQLALVQEPSTLTGKEGNEHIIQSPFCDLLIHSVAEGMRKIKFKGLTNEFCFSLSPYAHNSTEFPRVR